MLEARTRLDGKELDYYALSRLPGLGVGDPDRLPVTVKTLLETLLRDERAHGRHHWPGAVDRRPACSGA